MEKDQKTDCFGLSTLWSLALLLMGVAVCCGHCTDAPPATHEIASNGAAAIDYWTCTMHPSVKMKDAGTCPICSMNLEAVKRQEPVPREPATEYWTCTMHPSVKMKDTGTCPICSMNLEHVKKEGMSTGGELGEAARSMFRVEPIRQQLIGVRTEPVVMRSLDRSITTIGTVELDETRITYVHTKYSGWISKVFVNYTGQHVKKGDPLFSLYSPELVATQEEFLLARKAQRALGDHPLEEVAMGAHSLLTAARRRLLLWDITEEQLDKLAETGEVQKDLIVYSTVEGHVNHRNAFENMLVEPGTRIYTVADHSRVWVHVEVYENDIRLVRLGQDAVMSVDAYPGRRFAGKVTYIWPHLSEASRTLRVRLEFANPNLILKPGMYAQARLYVSRHTAMVVPTSAVLRTGERDIVFVSHGQGRMEARRIEVGGRFEDFYEVSRGLKLGEEVVAAANFLIDAESQVQGAIASWGGAER